MKSKMILLGSVAVLSIAAATQSQAHHQGWYVGLEGGGNWVSDNEGFVGFASDVPYIPDSIEFDSGWAVLGTVGYGFDSNWRVEFEAGYRSNDVDLFSYGYGERSRQSAELNEITLMANVLYDIPLSERLDLTFGLGIGGDRAEFDNPFFGGGSDDDWNFAYQGIVGLSYAITDRLDLTLQYRYLHVNDPEFNPSSYYGSSYQDHFAFDDLEKQTVTIGLRYDLYEDEAPPPPAAPPPPPPPPEPEAKQFIVFFGFNKSNLTPEALGVIKDAAAAAKEQGSATILVVGHTDTVGSNRYNDALSLRRSGAVKKGLVAEGVPASAISATGKGESELMVQTGDNVKEPQNRRATIDLH